MTSADPELVQAILAACESSEPGAVYRLLETRDERHRVFLTLQLLSEHDGRRAKADQVISGLAWSVFLAKRDRARFLSELVGLLDRIATVEGRPEDQQEFAVAAEQLLDRWHRVAERAMTPEQAARSIPRGRGRRPGSSWRFRVERPPLLDQPIVDSSNNHLTTVFSKLVVDEWFDLQRTDEDRWRIRIGDLGVVVSVDHAGRATRVLVDTPPGPPQPRPGKAPAFRITYVSIDGADVAHIRIVDPHPDLLPVLPTAKLWQAGVPWSILCGRGEESQLDEMTDPAWICRTCKAELGRIQEMIDGARWALARQLAGPQIEDVVRAKLSAVPF
ncbi:MAG: hypothetical protein ACRDYA_21500 [Egibacteraceae bacterium]